MNRNQTRPCTLITHPAVCAEWLRSRKALLVAAAAMAVVVGALLPATAFPNSHLVGDLDGWRLGVNYTVWAWNNDPIPVGDTLEFRYTAGDHTVVKVEEDGYNNCDVNNNMGFWDGGNDVVQLQEVGKHFFICGTGNHCLEGMKFAITAAPSECD